MDTVGCRLVSCAGTAGISPSAGDEPETGIAASVALGGDVYKGHVWVQIENPSHLCGFDWFVLWELAFLDIQRVWVWCGFYL